MHLEAYTNFASVYDTFMDQEPYEAWADRVCRLLKEYGLPVDVKTDGADAGTGEPDRGEMSCAADADRAGSAESAAQEEPAEDAAQDETVEGAAQAADERRIVVDLGCGTGKLTEILAARGYDMIGLDLSEDMLAIAMERRYRSGSDILYTLQDMRDFELYGAAGAMVSVGDSVNYLLEEQGLEDMFRCVQRALLPGGVFVFDFKTIHLYRDVIGDRTIAEDRGNCAFIWDNWYDPETCINEYDLAIFVAEEAETEAICMDPETGEAGLETGVGPVDPEAGEAGRTAGSEWMDPDVMTEDPGLRDGSLFRRYDEVHQQRGYEPDQLRRAAEKAGLTWITMEDAETGGAVTEMTERVMAVVRKE